MVGAIGKMGKGWCDVYSKLAGFYVCANFGENASRNVSVTVRADGHTDKLVLYYVHCYNIAMGQIM